MNTSFTRTCRVVSLAVSALFLLGCRAPMPSASASALEDGPLVEVTVTIGRILKVNEEQRYVIVDCVSLPSIGEAGIIFDGDHAVGRLLITGPLRTPFIVADITHGNAATGNTVKIVRQRRASAREVEESK